MIQESEKNNCHAFEKMYGNLFIKSGILIALLQIFSFLCKN